MNGKADGTRNKAWRNWQSGYELPPVHKSKQKFNYRSCTNFLFLIFFPAVGLKVAQRKRERLASIASLIFTSMWHDELSPKWSVVGFDKHLTSGLESSANTLPIRFLQIIFFFFQISVWLHIFWRKLKKKKKLRIHWICQNTFPQGTRSCSPLTGLLERRTSARTVNGVQSPAFRRKK